MADEGLIVGLLALVALGGAQRTAPAAPQPPTMAPAPVVEKPPDDVGQGNFLGPPTVRPTDDTGAPAIVNTTVRTLPDPTTRSTATVSPSADIVAPADLANFADLRLTANEVLVAGATPLSGGFIQSFTAGTVVVNVPVPGASYQQVRIQPYWTTVEGAQQALANAWFQQNTYPLGDPLWVHYEAVKIAAKQFLAANAPEVSADQALLVTPAPTPSALVVVNGQVTTTAAFVPRTFGGLSEVDPQRWLELYQGGAFGTPGTDWAWNSAVNTMTNNLISVNVDPSAARTEALAFFTPYKP